MGLAELFVLALSLSMDAFAVSLCKGLSLGRVNTRHMCLAGAWFGGFQALMPLIGYLVGSLLAGIITKFDHWIAFFLLFIIGFGMIREALHGEEENASEAFMDIKSMFMLALATSIDALAVGVTFAFLQVNILAAVSVIGITAFICSAAGIKAGSVFGLAYRSKAELSGGIALILIGLKILVEGLAGL